MIFWNAEKYAQYLAWANCVEALYVRYSPVTMGKESIQGKTKCLYFRQGCFFFNATVFKSEILVFDRKRRKQFRLPLVKEDAETFPDRFAIKTKNIELLRELIAQGKKVSWYDPDIYTQAHWLGILDFEHAFIDPFLDTHYINWDGECLPISNIQKISRIKGFPRVGFNLRAIIERIDWRARAIRRLETGKKMAKNCCITKNMAGNFYTIHSLTYLAWRQGKRQQNAMTAKK